MDLTATWSHDSTASAGAVYQNDGIDLQREHLKRQNSVSDIITLTRRRKHVVLGSPPAMGKTALLQLVKKELRKDDSVKVLHRCLSSVVTVETVKNRLEKLGLKDEEDSSSNSGRDSKDGGGYREIWILLDDAQNWYGEEYWGFWQLIVKHLPVVCSKKFYFVVAATYDLSTHSSPVQFATLEHYRQTAIQEEEVDQLFRMHITDIRLQNWELYLDSLKRLSKLGDDQYHIGVVLQGTCLLQDWNKHSGIVTKDEAAALSRLRTGDFTIKLKRCYAVPENLPEAGRTRIVDTILMPNRTTESQENDELLAPYVRAGILGRDGDFSCLAAMWFYNSCCFPGRTWSVPASIDDLITLSVEKLSASRMRNSLQDDFPKEAAFQHFFNEAMSMNLTNTNFLIPELNTWATGENGEEISGELDFFINGQLQWCVELLRNGDKIGEHLARFEPRTGKYRNVQARDYLVVDCRPPKRGRGAQIAVDRCNLYFEDNFTKCRVQMRTKPEIIISLQP